MAGLVAALLMVLLAPGLSAAEDLHHPPPRPPPARDGAMALVQELLDRVTAGGPSTAWLSEHLGPPTHPGPPSAAVLDRWRERLLPGAPVGQRLAASPGPVAAVTGPDYQRILVESAPGLSVVVVQSEDGPRISELAWTTCTLCTEPVRFVSDLLDDVARRGGQSHRLLPGVELDLEAHHDRHGLDQDWIGVLSLRNGQAGFLPDLLRGAEVVGANGEIVDVRYADGTRDTWTVRWKAGRWVVDYAGLAEDSPLRMSAAEERAWRDPSRRAREARRAWRPGFAPVAGGAGMELGHAAIDAWPDPRDGTVLVVVLDVDRVLTAVFRVDPATRQVVDRLRAPLADARTQLPLDGWGERWPTALSPDGRRLALAGPNRLWLLDLDSRQSRLLGRGDITWLAWDSGRDPALWSARGRTLQRLDALGMTTRERHEADVIGLAEDADRTWRITSDGSLATADGAVSEQPPLCCGEVVDAAVDPTSSRTLLTCGAGCDSAAVWVDGTRATPIPGAGSAQPGASCSPDGRWFTTGRDGGLLLWATDEARPMATLPGGPFRSARWSPDGRALLTVDGEGRVVWWELSQVVARFSVSDDDPPLP